MFLCGSFQQVSAVVSFFAELYLLLADSFMIVSASASKGVVSDEKLTYTDVFAWIHIWMTCLKTEKKDSKLRVFRVFCVSK